MVLIWYFTYQNRTEKASENKIVLNQNDAFLFGENSESYLAELKSPCYLLVNSVIVNYKFGAYIGTCRTLILLWKGVQKNVSSSEIRRSGYWAKATSRI